MKNRKKILLISSSGGHFEQLLLLRKLDKDNDITLVTEKTKYNTKDKKIDFFIPQINRKEPLVLLKILYIYLKSKRIYKKVKPDVIISTGVLASIPMLYIGHKKRCKVIYVESYANIDHITRTGKFIRKHKIADKIYVQWKTMLKYYPEAEFNGGIY